MSRMLILLFLITASFTVQAQNVNYAQFNTDKNLSFQKSLSTSDNKVLIIYGRERWMELCDYLYICIHDKPDVQTRVIKLPADKSKTPLYFKDAIVSGKEIWFVFLNYIKVNNTIQVVLIPFDINKGSLLRERAITLMQTEANDFFNGTLYLFQSPDKNQLGVLTISGLLESYQKRFTLSSVNLSNSSINFTMRDMLPADAHTYQLLKPLLDNDGHYYTLVKRFKQAGSELDGNKPNYFYLLEHFENDVIRRSTNLMPDIDQIARYPDAIITDSTQIQIVIPISDTSLVHIQQLMLQKYDIKSHRITDRKQLAILNNEPHINSAFISDVFVNGNQTTAFISGQYLEEVNGARMTHAFDIIKTYSIIMHCNGDDCKSMLHITRNRLREQQNYVFFNNNRLSMVNYAPNSNDYYLWLEINMNDFKASISQTLPSSVWKKNIPYYFLNCAEKTVLLQCVGTRYTIMYLQ